MDNWKKLLGIFFLGFLLLLVSGFWWFFEGGGKGRLGLAQRPAVEAQRFPVRQKIDYGDGAATVSAELSGREGENVFELLERSHQVTAKKYSFGVLVESIDQVADGKGNKYWIYYVNGQAAKVGADQYNLKPGDTVEWRFEEAKQ